MCLSRANQSRVFISETVKLSLNSTDKFVILLTVKMEVSQLASVELPFVYFWVFISLNICWFIEVCICLFVYGVFPWFLYLHYLCYSDLFVYVCIYFSICLFAFLFIYFMFIYLFAYSFIYLLFIFICLFTYFFYFLYIFIYLRLSICLFTYLFLVTYLFIIFFFFLYSFNYLLLLFSSFF